MPFDAILGQTKAHDYLKKIARTQQVPGALLFHGPDGVGKAKTALEFAKALNCQDPRARQTGESCGVCPSCRAIAQGICPDVTFVDFLYQARLEIKKDVSNKGYQEELEKELAKQQHISVDTVRKVATQSLQKAVGDGWKVLIIDQAQTMQAAAANALLKFIEEPPPKTVWILITNKRTAMLKTILSRCQPLAFAPLQPEQVVQILTQTGAETEHLDLCAKYSGGSVSGALKADHALTLLSAAEFGPNGADAAGPSAVAAELSRTLVTARQEAAAVLEVLSTALHHAWKDAATDDARAAYHTALNRFENYKRSLARNVSPALLVETALMSLDGLNVPVFEEKL